MAQGFSPVSLSQRPGRLTPSWPFFLVLHCGAHDRDEVAHRAAREPRRHARVLRLRHLRDLCEGHRRRNISESHAAHFPHGVIRRVRGRLSRTSDRWHRAQPFRRSLRPASRVPGLDSCDVHRHIRHGAGAAVRLVGSGREHADDCAAAHPGILPRWRTARRTDLRRRDSAATCIVCLRCGLFVRHPWRGSGHRAEPRGSLVAAAGVDGLCRMAHRVYRRRACRVAGPGVAALARRVAGVRTDEAPRVASSRSAKC